MNNVLVAGATGYLGKHLLAALTEKGFETIALVRNATKLDSVPVDRVIEAEATQPETLKGQLEGVDYVISTLGITRQKDGLTYLDVDYQANANLLAEAQKAGVNKFMYVSVLNGPQLRHLKMVEAKEKLVDELKASGLDYTVIRPNGFFSDMTEVLEMAKNGKVYLFGDGQFQGNPIHGADLAAFMVDHLDTAQTELEVGGPEVLTQQEIAKAAFRAIHKPPRITHIPIWVSHFILSLTRFFTGQKIYGPIEFFMTVMTMDMVAPQVGHHELEDFYRAQR